MTAGDTAGTRTGATTARRVVVVSLALVVVLGTVAALSGTAAAAVGFAMIHSPQDTNYDGTIEVRSAESAAGASTITVIGTVDPNENVAITFDRDGDFTTTNDQGSNGARGVIAQADINGEFSVDLTVDGGSYVTFVDGDTPVVGISQGTEVTSSPERRLVGLEVDNTPPQLTGATSLDTDGDGTVDRVDVTYSEDVSASTPEAGDYSFSGGDGGAVTVDSASVVGNTIQLAVTAPADDTALDLVLGYDAIAGTDDSVTDGVNPANGFNGLTVSDGAAPVPTNATYLDVDGDATVDRIDLNFTEDVSASNVEMGDFSLGGQDGQGVSVPAGSLSGSTVQLAVVDAPANDTGLDLTLSYDASAGLPDSITDGTNPTQDFSGLAVADGAAPVRTGLKYVDTDANGQVDGIEIAYSEPLATGVPETGDYTLGGPDATGVSKVGVTKPTGAVLLELSGAPVNDTSLSLTLSYGAGGSLPDVSDGANEAASFGATPVDDGAAPRFVSVTTGDADGDGRVDTLNVTFTEGVAIGSVEADDFSVGSANGLAAGTAVTGVEGDDGDANVSLSLTPGGEYDTNATPTVAYAEDGSGASVVDTSTAANAMADATSVAATDGAAPVAVEGTYLDTDGDGTVDTALVNHSEPVAATSTATATDWTVETGGSVGMTGVTGASFSASATVSLAVDATSNVTGGVVNPVLNYTGTSVSDGTLAAPSRSATLGDGAAPVVTGATARDVNGDGTVDRIDVSHTEDVSASTPEAGDYTFAGADAVATTGTPSVAGDTVQVAVEGPATNTALSATVSYAAAAGTAGSVVDGDGNAARSATGVTVADGAGPSLASATTRDVVGGGAVDTIEVTFTEAVDDTTVSAQDFKLSAGAVDSVSHPAGTDDDTVTLAVSGGVTQDVTVYLGSATVTDVGGATGPMLTHGVVAADGAPAALASATTRDTNADGDLDAVEVTFTEAVDDHSLSASAFSLSAGGVEAVDTGATANDDTVVLSVRNVGSTDATPSVTVAPNTVADRTGNRATVASTVGADDGAGPALVNARVDSRHVVVVSFSELLDDSASALNADTFDVQPGRVEGVETGIDDDDVLRLNVSRIGRDSVTVVAAAGGVSDAAGNAPTANSSVTAQIRLAGFLDVSIRDVPESVVGGEAATVNVTAENVGEARTSQTLELRTNGTVVDSADVSVGAGEQVNVSLVWRTAAADAGERRVRVVSQNDADAANLTVLEPAAVEVSNLVVSPTTVGVDDPVSVAATVANTGGVGTEYTVPLMVDGAPVETRSGTLAPGESTGVAFEWTFEAAGLHTVTVGDLPETNVTVQESAPVLSVTSFSAPGSVERNGSVSVDVTVENTGPTAGNATVDYRLDADGDGTLAPGETLASASVSVSANDTATVTLTANVTVAAGSYTHGVVFAGDERTATLAVTDGDGNQTGPIFDAPVDPGAPAPPTDPDGDGIYDDVDGDGVVDFDDAIALAFADTGSLTAAQTAALDIDGDGDVDFDDAIELAFRV